MDNGILSNTKKDQPIKCKLKILKCYRTSESNGDEIFIRLHKKKIWPKGPFARIKAEDDLLVNVIILLTHEDEVRLELLEKDLFTSQVLGYFTFTTGSKHGQYSTDLKLSDKNANHRYTLIWEI